MGGIFEYYYHGMTMAFIGYLQNIIQIQIVFKFYSLSSYLGSLLMYTECNLLHLPYLNKFHVW
jgi:hypothetical protein